MACPTTSQLSHEATLLTYIHPPPSKAEADQESNDNPGSKPKPKPDSPTIDLHLLRTNYHPISPTDLSLIHTYLHSATSMLSNLDSDIEHLQNTLANLFTKRSQLKQAITSHKSLLAPIRRLPNELLSEIFLSRGDGVGDIGFTNLDLARDTVWTILRVSSHWRSVARSTPRLWNTLLIDLTPLKSTQPQRYSQLVNRLSFCLSHFLPTTLPLNFALTGTHYSESSLLHPLLNLLCSHSHRWHNVYFCAYTTSILSNYCKLDSEFRQLDTPHLNSIGLTSFNPAPGFIQTNTRFMHTSNLTKLALYDYRVVPHVSTSPSTLGSSIPNFCPPFSPRITHLYLDSCPYSTYPDILPYLPSLTHLTTLNKKQNSFRPFDTTQRIPLPNLVVFKTTGWLTNLCFLLPHLDMPSIEQVKIVALEEQCYPCTCSVVKLRMVNEWLETLGRSINVLLDHMSSSELKTSTDEGMVRFLFSDMN